MHLEVPLQICRAALANKLHPVVLPVRIRASHKLWHDRLGGTNIRKVRKHVQWGCKFHASRVLRSGAMDNERFGQNSVAARGISAMEWSFCCERVDVGNWMRIRSCNLLQILLGRSYLKQPLMPHVEVRELRCSDHIAH